MLYMQRGDFPIATARTANRGAAASLLARRLFCRRFLLRVTEGSTTDWAIYFAYGSNMIASQMARRCPGARLIGPALIRDYRFRINRRGVATVLPETAAIVRGALWSLT